MLETAYHTWHGKFFIIPETFQTSMLLDNHFQGSLVLILIKYGLFCIFKNFNEGREKFLILKQYPGVHLLMMHQNIWYIKNSFWLTKIKRSQKEKNMKWIIYFSKIYFSIEPDNVMEYSLFDTYVIHNSHIINKLRKKTVLSRH